MLCLHAVLIAADEIDTGLKAVMAASKQSFQRDQAAAGGSKPRRSGADVSGNVYTALQLATPEERATRAAAKLTEVLKGVAGADIARARCNCFDREVASAGLMVREQRLLPGKLEHCLDEYFGPNYRTAFERAEKPRENPFSPTTDPRARPPRAPEARVPWRKFEQSIVYTGPGHGAFSGQGMRGHDYFERDPPRFSEYKAGRFQGVDYDKSMINTESCVVETSTWVPMESGLDKDYDQARRTEEKLNRSEEDNSRTGSELCGPTINIVAGGCQYISSDSIGGIKGGDTSTPFPSVSCNRRARVVRGASREIVFLKYCAMHGCAGVSSAQSPPSSCALPGVLATWTLNLVKASVM